MPYYEEQTVTSRIESDQANMRDFADYADHLHRHARHLIDP
jgi:hypothetical protein